MPKIVDHDIRREEIAKIVRDLVIAEGVESASFRGICRAGGFSTGVLSYYFENQEDLMRYVFVWHTKQLEDRLRALVTHLESDGPSRFSEVLWSLMPGGPNLSSANDVYFSSELWRFMMLRPHMLDQMRAAYAPVQALTAQAVQIASGLPADQAATVALFVQAAIDGNFIHQRAGLIGPDQAGTMVEHLTRYVLSCGTDSKNGNTK